MDGVDRHLRDVMNPPGMFLGGKRQREYSQTSDMLPSSGKLIPEFFGRRNIRDMFARKPSLQQSPSNGVPNKEANGAIRVGQEAKSMTKIFSPIGGSVGESCDSTLAVPTRSPSAAGKKRSAPAATGSKSTKRGKSGSATATLPVTGKGQQSLKGFFRPSICLDSNDVNANKGKEWTQKCVNDNVIDQTFISIEALAETRLTLDVPMDVASLDPATQTTRKVGVGRVPGVALSAESSNAAHRAIVEIHESVHDPVESKESWSKLFTKPTAPRCEGHDEPCISLLTKKPGMNLGRSFWICPRPLGPSGAKEKNTQWRCQTFIWCSDWNPNLPNV